MTEHIYDYWLQFDRWTFYEAACLLNGIIPEHHQKSSQEQPFTKTINRHSRNQGFKGPQETLRIFQDAEWEIYGDKPKNEKVKVSSLLEFAANKKMKLPNKLLEAIDNTLDQQLQSNPTKSDEKILSGAKKAISKLTSYNTQKSIDATEKWKPLVKEVVDEININDKKITDACRHVCKRHGLDENKAKTLRSNYYKLKNSVTT